MHSHAACAKTLDAIVGGGKRYIYYLQEQILYRVSSSPGRVLASHFLREKDGVRFTGCSARGTAFEPPEIHCLHLHEKVDSLFLPTSNPPANVQACAAQELRQLRQRSVKHLQYPSAESRGSLIRSAVSNFGIFALILLSFRSRCSSLRLCNTHRTAPMEPCLMSPRTQEG